MKIFDLVYYQKIVDHTFFLPTKINQPQKLIDLKTLGVLKFFSL